MQLAICIKLVFINSQFLIQCKLCSYNIKVVNSSVFAVKLHITLFPARKIKNNEFLKPQKRVTNKFTKQLHSSRDSSTFASRIDSHY